MSKRASISLETRLAILEDLKHGTQQSVATKYKLGQSTIASIKKNEVKVKEDMRQNKNLKTKRNRLGKHEEVDEAVIKWFQQMRTSNAPVDGPMLKEKATQFAVTLGADSFISSNGWLSRLKERLNINFKKFEGERAAADDVSANQWKTAVLPTLLQEYTPKDIYNADESGLYFRATPKGTFSAVGECPLGGKIAKDRLTVLLLCNQDGSDKQAFVIGKSLNPRCLARVAQLPVPYFSNRNAWMTGEIWNKIIMAFDAQIEKENHIKHQTRKVLLFADNATCHKITCRLNNIKIEFLPPNTTSLIQPLDQGIIQNTKVHYRRLITRRLLDCVGNGKSVTDFVKSITLLDAMHMLKRAWWLVTPTTIQNCFKKAGFLNLDTVDDVEIREVEQLDGITAADFNDVVACDDTLECYGSVDDDEICQDVISKRPKLIEKLEVNDDDIDLQEIPANPITRGQVLASLSTIRSYLQENSSNADDFNMFYALEDHLLQKMNNNVSQKKITDFFASKIMYVIIA